MRLLTRQAAFALAAALLAPAAPAEVWQWTDAEGVVRYTPNPDRVPESRRGSLVKVEPGMEIPAPRPSKSPVMYAPPEELPFEADPFHAPEPARTLEVPEAGASTTPAPTGAPEVPEAESVPTPERAGAPEVTEAASADAPEPARTPEVPEVRASTAPAPRVPPREEPGPPPANRPLSDAERARRAQLEAQIAADEEALKQLISRQSTEGEEPLRESPELREIARRLPALQAELQALDGVQERRGERAAPEP